jgi:hypothetical protein
MNSVRYEINDIKDDKKINRIGFINLNDISVLDIDNTSGVISISMNNGIKLIFHKKDFDYKYGYAKNNQLKRLSGHMDNQI